MVCSKRAGQEIIRSFYSTHIVEGLLCQHREYGSEQDKVPCPYGAYPVVESRKQITHK